MGGAAFHLHREMACTRSEFMAWLAAATGATGTTIANDVVSVAMHRGTVDITLQERPPRRLGAIALPVLGVDFCFRDMEETGRNEFLRRFDLYTRRGGG